MRATTDFLVAKNVEIENAVNDAWCELELVLKRKSVRSWP